MKSSSCRHAEVKDQPSVFLPFIVRLYMCHHTLSSYQGCCHPPDRKSFFFFLFHSLKLKYLFKCLLSCFHKSGSVHTERHLPSFCLVCHAEITVGGLTSCYMCSLEDFVGLNLVVQLFLCRMFNSRKFLYVALQLCQVRYFLPTVM